MKTPSQSSFKTRDSCTNQPISITYKINKSFRHRYKLRGVFHNTSKAIDKIFSAARTECREILRISPYSFRIRKNADRNNSEYGQFSRSVEFGIFFELKKISEEAINMYFLFPHSSMLMSKIKNKFLQTFIPLFFMHWVKCWNYDFFRL